MTHIYYEHAPQEGWMCPKCGCVFAPFVTECYRCNGAKKVIEDSGTTTPTTSKPQHTSKIPVLPGPNKSAIYGPGSYE